MKNIALLSAAHIHTGGYLKAIDDSDKCRLVAVWDDVEDRGQRYATDHEGEYVADLDAVVAREDVDGFIICAENTRHLPLLEAAIPAGKPIFCEKPFTTSRADAKRAMELIDEHGTPVHMGYFQPFTAAMQGVAAILEDQRLGKVTQARFRNAHHAAYGRWFDSDDLAWFYDPELAGGGAFMDMGTHAVHLLRTLLGPVDSVCALIGNASGIYDAVDDHGMAMLRFSSGVLGTVEASWIQTGGQGGLEITGSEGTLCPGPDGALVIQAPGKEATAVSDGQEQPKGVDRLLATIEGELSADELRRDLVCAADSAAIMEACYRSSQSAKWESP